MNARQKADFETMLIHESMRRLRRQTPRDIRTWALWSQMTPGERFFIACISAPVRFREWLQRRIRA